mgnify:CR=1 FL=1
MDHFEYIPPDELYLNEDMMNEMIKTMVKDVAFHIHYIVQNLIFDPVVLHQFGAFQ